MIQPIGPTTPSNNQPLPTSLQQVEDAAKKLANDLQDAPLYPLPDNIKTDMTNLQNHINNCQATDSGTVTELQNYSTWMTQVSNMSDYIEQVMKNGQDLLNTK